MRLPSFKRIIKTDYEQQFQKMIETLSYSVNYGIEALNNALNNNISLSDNIKCTIKTFSVEVDASGTPTTSTTLPVSFSGTINGVTVMDARNTTNSVVYPTSGVFVSWTQTQNGLFINNITGLQAKNAYSIKIIIWG